MSAPVAFQWDGEAMVPRHPKIADREFVVGEVYALVEHHDRSSKSHAHYFAAVTEGWKNLPEDIADRYPTSEHLRKAALIRTGWRDERTFVCASKAEAIRLAAFMRPVDDTAIITASEGVVCVYTAKSQSMKAMGREDFQKSKDEVLGYISSLIGVTTTALQQHARAA